MRFRLIHSLFFCAILLRILGNFHQPTAPEGARGRCDRSRGRVEKARRGQGALVQIGRLRQGQYRIMRGEFVEDGLELDVTPG